MNILFATSEMVPFTPPGETAEAIGVLAGELARLGHSVSVILPGFGQAIGGGRGLEPTGVDLAISIGTKLVTGRVVKLAWVPRPSGPSVTVYLVEQNDYYQRPGLYQEGGTDYIDNCERFVFFSRAVLETTRQLKLRPDVIHAHDWTTGLLAAYLDVEYRDRPGFERLATLFTLHDLEHQGKFWHWDMLLTGLDWKYFNWRQMEFYGHLNLLKTGLVFADSINTLSPRYAQEVQTAPLGGGLEGVLASRREVLSGVVDGLDYEVWNPANDPFLTARYDERTAAAGKARAKAALQTELGLPQQADVPLVALAGRLCDRRGVDVAIEVIRNWPAEREVQWAVLGTGDAKHQEALADLVKRQPRRLSLRLAQDEPLLHRLMSGADILLAPCRGEPCGKQQLQALRYGAVPVVRNTGSLADTVNDVNEGTLSNGTATGFCFHDTSPLGVSESLARAVDMYGREKNKWSKLVSAGMKQDWSWTATARQYLDLYGVTIARRQARGHV